MQYTLRPDIVENKDLFTQVMHTRKVMDISRYLNPSPKDEYSYLELDNIDEAVSVLDYWIKNEGNIFIVIDSDADGYTSAAALINYLYLVLPQFTQDHISYTVHTGKQHGLIMDEIPHGTNLIILPDSSSSDLTQHLECVNRNIDVIVLDHHESDNAEFNTYATIVNNQLCNYPNKTLSGAGVVYKFLECLDHEWHENKAFTQIGLVSCGIIGDVMDVRNFETNYIIREGIKHYNANPFLKAALKKNEYFFNMNGLNITSVAFYIVPLINGCIRMGSQEEKITLFESMLLFKGNELVPSTKRGAKKGDTEIMADQAVRISSNLKNKQNKLRDSYLNDINQIITSNNLLNDYKILFICLEKLDKNLTGLIANKVANLYQRPTLIVQKTENYTYAGSGRNFSNSPVEDFKDLCAQCGASLAQGHKSAFGFIIPIQNKELFLQKSNEYLKDINMAQSYFVDKIFQEDNIDINGILDVGTAINLWGQGLEEPIFAFEKIIVTQDNCSLLSPDRHPTLKINANNLEFIKFQAESDFYNIYPSEFGATEVTFIGTASVNEWGGRMNPQIKILDYHITDRKEVYF